MPRPLATSTWSSGRWHSPATTEQHGEAHLSRVQKLSQLGDAEQDTTLVTSPDLVDMIVLARAVPHGSHSLAAHFGCTVR
jgi:hypothetical protein